ncbi:MAG: DNA primase [Verrucomicrobiae bacterium]|nr:DNA primase [Verrucomicrobiae bacterium]
MSGIAPQTIERIRAANDIVEVISGYLPLKRAGANFVALCPFHREKTPSFNVNPQRQIFHCFGCHKGGDVFTFVMAYENIGFLDAVRRLAERARIPIEWERDSEAAAARHLKDVLLEMHEQIARRWHACLLNDAAGQAARDYLAQRGVPPEAVKLFRLGYAPDAWEDTVNWARSKGYDLALVEKAGLIIRREKAEGWYDRFRGRLMFPICDEQGRVIGFSGRVIAGDEKTAKYVNSPETPIFSKGRVFFGLDKARRAILDAGRVIVCEGQLDLIACHMAGVQNVVAPQGTALTAEHARLLKRYCEEVVLCFDSDEAGQNAAIRSLDPLLASGLAMRVAVVPAPHDPDSFIREHGGEAFRKLIAEAEGFFDFLLNRLCREHDPASDRGRLSITRAMATAALKTGNQVLLDTCAQKTAFRLGVSVEAVRAEFRKVSAPRADAEPAGETPEAAPRPSPLEFWLLKLLFVHEELVAWAAMHLLPDWIEHSLVRDLVRRRFEAQASETWLGLPAFLDSLPLPEMQALVTEAATETRPIPNPEQQIADVTLRLRNLHLDRQLATLTARLAQPETSPSERMSLLRQQQELRQQKRQPLVPLADLH